MKAVSKISQATQFKIRYAECGGDSIIVKEKLFKTIKIMEQWVARHDNDFYIFIVNRYAFIESAWEAFTTIGKKTITLSELKNITKRLEDETLKHSIIKK